MNLSHATYQHRLVNAVTALLLLTSSLALAVEPVSMTTTAQRKDQRLDISKLNRKQAELAVVELFSNKPLFQQPVAVDIPQEPTTPSLPFVFIGRIIQDGVETIFLSIENQSYVVKLKDIIDVNYQVNSIEKDKIVFTYLPMNAEQVLNISND